MSRQQRAQIADETLRILKSGTYTTKSGKAVSIADSLRQCVEQTILYESVIDERTGIMIPTSLSKDATTITVANESTLGAARRMNEQNPYQRIGVLNFASAKHPGGGFREGSHAQEESLARGSGLFSSLLKCDGFYSYHKGMKSCLYTNRIIYSPGCPVFRDDKDRLLDVPYCVDFLTSPAPNAGAVRRNEPERIGRIPEVLQERIKQMLALFLKRKCDRLVLGAWGCGVFQNDPEIVAKTFAEFLLPGGLFYGHFYWAHFAVLDPAGHTFQIFHNTLLPNEEVVT